MGALLDAMPFKMERSDARWGSIVPFAARRGKP